MHSNMEEGTSAQDMALGRIARIKLDHIVGKLYNLWKDYIEVVQHEMFLINNPMVETWVTVFFFPDY